MSTAAPGARSGAQCGAAALICGALRLAPGFLVPSRSATQSPELSTARSAVPLGGRLTAAPLRTRPQATQGTGTQPRLGASLLGAGVLACVGQRRLNSKLGRRASSLGAGEIEDAVPFELRGFSLATLFLLVGVGLIVFSFADYFIFGMGGGSGIGGLTFIYAVPVILLGAALSYAELQPVQVETERGAEGIFDRLATPTMTKIVNDVTRHRYGDDAHLDSSLKALGLTAATGAYPKLKKVVVSKSSTDELEFTMLFASKEVPFTTWSDPMKIVACDRFFGPGIWTQIYKHDAGKRIAALRLTTGAKPEEKPARENA